jgi:prepilin-type N-terminal cleavage/methylation domain-containing protein
MQSSRSEAGFTLVEVMIAIVLLVMISVAIYQATTQTFKYRAKIIGEGDFHAGIRLSMGLMDRDISSLFSPVNLNPKNFPDPSASAAPPTGAPGSANPRGSTPAGVSNVAAQAQQLDELSKSELGKTSDFWLGATDLTAIRPSRFVGTENKISFVSASHMRIYKNSEECEFAKIIYELRDEKDPDAGESTKVLVKIEDSDVFNDSTLATKTKVAKAYPLLTGIKKFKFRYYRKDKKAWENTWDSSHDDMKGLYPDIVELSLEVVGIQRLSFKGIYMFKPETPFYGMDPTL